MIWNEIRKILWFEVKRKSSLKIFQVKGKLVNSLWDELNNRSYEVILIVKMSKKYILEYTFFHLEINFWENPENIFEFLFCFFLKMRLYILFHIFILFRIIEWFHLYYELWLINWIYIFQYYHNRIISQ